MFALTLDTADEFSPATATAAATTSNHPPVLRELVLRGNGLGTVPSDCDVMAGVLADPRCRLEALDLSHNALKDDGLRAVALSFGRCRRRRQQGATTEARGRSVGESPVDRFTGCRCIVHACMRV